MTTPTRRELPFGVVVVALGFLLNALLFALVIAGIREGTRLAERMLAEAGWLSPTYGLLIAVNVLVALLLLRRHPLGWVLAMLFVCLALAVYLVGWWLGTAEYIRMAIYSAMALYLNQREVRLAFAQAGGPAPTDQPAEPGGPSGPTTSEHAGSA
jgi:hypothetical protein